MSENQIAPVGEGSTGLDWFVQCLLIGFVIGLGVNAVSYFFLSDGIVDLIGNNNKVAEFMGFPQVFWVEKTQAADGGSIDYSSLGWNLMYGLVLGGLMGCFAFVFRRPLNASVQRRRLQHNSRRAGSYFQLTMRGILMLTTVAVATVAVWTQFSSIERKPVDSSNIVSMGYSGATKILEVEFRSGTVYQYFQVPRKAYAELESADSKGRHLARNIRDKFQYERLQRKQASVFLIGILMLGPIYLLTVAVLLNRLSLETKVILAAVLGALLICVSMSSLVRVEMNPDRVLLGLFVFWMPQIALFVLLRSIVLATRSLFFKGAV